MKGIKRERVKGRGIERESERKKIERESERKKIERIVYYYTKVR